LADGLGKKLLRFHAMSEEQLTALLAKLKEDEGLRERFKGAADLDAAVAMAQQRLTVYLSPPVNNDDIG